MQSTRTIISVTPPPPPPAQDTFKLFLLTVGVPFLFSLIIFSLSCCIPLSIALPLGFGFIILGFITFILLYFSLRS
jgi:hypothetical protein